ncbi:MAG: hypothetical protein JSR59_25840 [Proteobacteria bacterium]|nr:hypothetical protein [Pseudomonadota bacterium]
MKARFLAAMATGALSCCLAAGYGPAHATTTQSGTACAPAGTGGYGSPVVCPVVRLSEVPAGGVFGLRVDGFNTQTYPVTCTLYSYSYTGALLGAASFNPPATPWPQSWDAFVGLPASQVPPYSSQALYCQPGSSGGVFLFDYEPNL